MNLSKEEKQSNIDPDPSQVMICCSGIYANVHRGEKRNSDEDYNNLHFTLLKIQKPTFFNALKL